MENKYKNLIIEVIKQNERFAGNEALLNEIYEDAVVRLGGILESINDEAIIRGYVERIAKLSIITICRKQDSQPKAPKKNEQPSLSTPAIDYYKIFNYEPEVTDESFQATILAEIESEICKLDKEAPAKEFIKLYRLRYQEKKSLEEVSEELNISQAQAAERLFEITALVKRICSNEMSQV